MTAPGEFTVCEGTGIESPECWMGMNLEEMAIASGNGVDSTGGRHEGGGGEVAFCVCFYEERVCLTGGGGGGGGGFKFVSLPSFDWFSHQNFATRLKSAYSISYII